MKYRNKIGLWAVYWDLSFFAVAVPAVVFAGVSKAGFGSGASFASASILALILTPGEALGLMLPLLIVMDFAAIKTYWGKWDWPSSRLLLLGSGPGVLLGAGLYQFTNDDFLRLLIGVISIGFVVWQLGVARGWFRIARSVLPDWVGVFAGMTAGFTSFVSHAGGPPASVYMLSLKLGKTEYQAGSVVIFWIINMMKAAAYGVIGIFTWDMLVIDIVLVPFALLGAWIGIKAHRIVPEKHFFAITYVLLSATGLKLIFDSLT